MEPYKIADVLHEFRGYVGDGDILKTITSLFLTRLVQTHPKLSVTVFEDVVRRGL